MKVLEKVLHPQSVCETQCSKATLGPHGEVSNIDLFSLTRLPAPGLQTPAERTSLSPVVFHIPSLSPCILAILNPSLLLLWSLALKVARSTASQHNQSKSQGLYNGPCSHSPQPSLFPSASLFSSLPFCLLFFS